MTALQKEAIALIPAIPDEKLYYVLQLLKSVTGLLARPDAEAVPKHRKRVIGIARGEAYCADGYDFDAEDPEITAMFEGTP